MEQGGTEKITEAELKVILEYAGKTSDDALSALTKWIRGMPDYMAKLEPEALKYLKSRWSRFTEQGMADDILKALEKKCGGLADDAVMGLDDVKAVVEKAGIKGSSEIVLAKYGNDFGKMGTYVEPPGIKVDWSQYAEHGFERMQQRGMTKEMVDKIVLEGKALSQNGGNKFAFITKEGVAVVSKDGKLIIAWSSDYYDNSMREIIVKLFGE